MDWGRFRLEIGRKLSDPEHRKYKPELLRDCVNDALRDFASSHTGVARESYIVGDSSNWQFPLPEDMVDEENAGVYAVQWDSNTWLQRADYWPGSSWESRYITAASYPLRYVMWPVGCISFTRIPEKYQQVKIYYVGYYDEVVDDQSLITVPVWAREAIKLYAAAVALEPMAVKAANLGQFKSKREAGHPEHNPLLREAEYMMKRYRELLRTHATPQYRLLQPPGGRR